MNAKPLKFLIVLLLILLTMISAGCDTVISFFEHNVDKIEVVNDSVKASYKIDEFDISSISMMVYLQSGRTITLQVDEAMLDEADREKLQRVGTHTLTITYYQHTTTIQIQLVQNYHEWI